MSNAIAADAPIEIPYLPSIKVDGNTADWEGKGVRVTAFAEDGLPSVQTHQFTPEMRLGWTEIGLAVLVKLQSTEPWTEERSARVGYKRDSIELFLRKGSQWRNLVQAVITPGLTDEHKEARSYMWDYRGDPQKWADLPAEVRVTSKRIDGGANVEVMIPWKQLRLKPEADQEVEFRVNLNKVVSGARRQLTWRQSDGNEFQRIVLKKEASSTHDRAAWIITSELDQIGIGAVAPTADGSITVQQGDTEVASGKFRMAGKCASLALWLSTGAITPGNGQLKLSRGKQVVATATVPNVSRNLAHLLERTMFGRWRWRHAAIERITPQLPVVVKTGDLPSARFPEPNLAELAGVTSIETTWYNAAQEPVKAATTVGRYGAVVKVKLKGGMVLRSYRTAIMPDDAMLNRVQVALEIKGDNSDSLRILTSALERDGGLLRALLDGGKYPNEADQRWWHQLRTKLGTQTVYPYGKRMPKGYAPDGKKLWPAIIYLHGGSGRLPSQQASFEDRVRSALDRDLLGWAGSNPRPFAMYALQSNGGWEPPAVIDALDRILKEDKIDPERVIIMGFSMGGMGTWNVMTEYANRFAAAVPIGGRMGRVDQMNRIGKLPVWIFNGDADRTTTLKDARIGEEALHKAGGDVRFTVLPNIGHGGSQNGTFNTKGLWEWLSERRRLK